MGQNSPSKLLFSWLPFPSLTDTVLIACSFRSFLTWGNNLSVLRLTAAFVRHARPGTGVGASGCRIHTEINSSELGEASGRTSHCAPLRLGVTSSVTDRFHKPGSPGTGPLDQVRHWVLPASCACRRMVLGGVFIHRPLSVWVVLCSWKQTLLGIHLKFILTGLRDKEDQKERKWQDSVISVITEPWA